jgi:arginyl-tRNA synthetase
MFEHPRRREHGDWATNIALNLAAGKGNPRPIAEAIVGALPASDLIDKAEVAGPGFINLTLSPRWWQGIVARAADVGSGFGRSQIGAGQKVNVEFVSANPTGPVNVVSGRHAAVGDTIAALLEATGHEVTREFYVNDVGRQIELFGESIAVRYLQALGETGQIPDEGYHGDYLVPLAKSLVAEFGDSLKGLPRQELVDRCARIGVSRMLDEMKASLERFRTVYDVWSSQGELHESGKLEEGIEQLRASGWTEEREGALWFLSSKLGDDKDRVLVRSDGRPTYLASDVAYLLDKFGRGFDHLIYLLGADHHGTIPRFLAASEALGFRREQVEVPLVQVVTLIRGGEAVKSSKRAGAIVPLDELIDEVGVDAARYTFLARSMEAPLEFDIELAREQAPENPVYYVQYAHARICSILRKAKDSGASGGQVDLQLLVHPSEDELMRRIGEFEEVVPDAALGRAPQKMCRYVEELAAGFSAFYRDCIVVSEDAALTEARLELCRATRNVLQSGLGLLGVSAPESM